MVPCPSLPMSEMTRGEDSGWDLELPLRGVKPPDLESTSEIRLFEEEALELNKECTFQFEDLYGFKDLGRKASQPPHTKVW